MAEDRTGSFFGGLIVGAVIGFALGILFAPQSGEETREMLKKETKEIGEKGKHLAEEVKSKGREFLFGKGIEVSEEESKKEG